MFSNKILLLAVVALMAGCAESDSDKVGDAQFCLDNTTDYSQSSIDACTASLSGIESKDAYMVRCSANFIIEGFADPNKFISAFDQLKGKSSNATTAMMSVLAFKSQTTATGNKDFAQTTFNHCTASGSAGATLISSFANLATYIAATTSIASSLVTGGSISATQMASAVSELGNSSNETLGATAQAAYATSCASGSESNAQLCQTLGAAVTNGTSAADIGLLLRAQLAK
jgi:hypothetical protein